MEYVGEHLFWGQLGNFFIVAAFCLSLLATISYYFASNSVTDSQKWLPLARISFKFHSISVFGIIGTLFYMLSQRFFEYHYVWEHTNTIMPMRYIFSAFWEGQEGSFLLWTFWHAFLGLILMKTAKDWEAPVMTIFSSAQVFLTSMVLGIYIVDYKLGSNPFTVLLREDPQFANIPLFSSPDYLTKLDGRGLNPLLQNYWMTIHPPTLFLGFASTLIPFCYGIAALWKGRFNEWLKPALPWTVFGVMILGTGILMGGAWAYEALSFGGFWAWDPVENASLVPWITFVGALHVMLVPNNKGASLFTAFGLILISFILVLYSTFLTRSGILGESSVHAFTDLGMTGQLLIYLFFYVALALVLLIYNYKKFPKNEKEESIFSREFWMFVGALVLLISAFQITYTTSIPVTNKLFGTSLAPPVNPIAHYNQWQVPFAIVIALIMGFTQFLKYKDTNPKEVFKNLRLPLISAAAITITFGLLTNYKNPFYVTLLFAGLFSVAVNFSYFIKVYKGKFKKAGSSIAHIGFGLVLLGALISTSASKIISKNVTDYDITSFGESYDNQQNILLFKNDTLKMGDYLVSYRGKDKEGVNVFYNIDYSKKNESGKLVKDFTLRPRVQLNNRMGNVAEPDTRHFLMKDIYTHVTYAKLESEDKKEDNVTSFEMEAGDTIFSSNAIIVLEGLTRNIDTAEYHLTEKDIAVGAVLKVFSKTNEEYKTMPLFLIRDTSFTYSFPSEIEQLGLTFNFDRIYPETGKAQITLTEKQNKNKEFIIMKAVIFPYINVLWIGALLIVIGSLLAIKNRVFG